MGVKRVAMLNLGLVCLTALLIAISFSPITFAGIVQGNDSIYTFNVSDCHSLTSSVGCNATTIRFNCSITPYAFIDEVQFYIDSIYYTTSRENERFWYDWSKPITLVDTNTTIQMTRQKITDVDNKSVLDFETVSINHSCDVCDATYNVTYGTCYTNNTQDGYYVSNDPCAADYNQTVYCNYCDPDWTARTGGIYECNVTNQKFVFYDDFNTCYAITGLSEDAPPFDHNTTVSCDYYENNMTCDVDSNPYFTDKINIICSIPSAHQNESFNCITYVKPILNSTDILQSNPEYKNYAISTSLISFSSKENEPKEFFTPQGTILNAYYTNKNLETDRQFVVGIECTSDTTNLVSEYPITPTYKGFSVVMNRMVWAKDNLGFILIFVIFIVVVISLLIWLITRRRS